jgi:pectate lyase
MKSNILKSRLLTGSIPSAGMLAILILVPLVALAPSSRASLLFYDGFDYTAGNSLGSSDSTADWENAKSQITITAESLNHGGLQSSTGNRVTVTGGSSNLDGARTKDGAWVSQTNGTLYVSFLLKLNGIGGIAANGDGTPIVNLCRTGSSSQQLLSLNLLNDSGIKLGVLKYPSSSTPNAAVFFASGPGGNLSADGATTYLIVAKYAWVDGAANDIVTVWVNPGNLGGLEDNGNKVFTSTGADGTVNAGRLFINRGPTLDLDELRLGTTWAAVTPTGSPVVVPQPVITESFLVPGGFVLRGSNGPASGIYQVLNATNIFHPLNLWSSIATNQFDPAGKFDCTNAVPLSATESFYRLQLGGSVPPAPTAPSITTQPTNRTVLPGQNATFSVGASGATPLAYQWFFSNAPIANAIATAYTVTNVQPTNVGGYYVLITNSLGSVTSLVANLAVVAIPAVGVPDGYATLNDGTTGGAGGPTVTVSTLEEFEFYLDDEAGPCVILIQGTINLGGSNVRVRDNKTIIGLGNNATLVGDLKVDGNNNVIIRNLTFTNPNGAGDKDGLTLQDCRNVWVDHCTFVDCDDGSLDISHGADWITVSWCHFYYTNPTADHRFANLVGHSDSSSAEAEDTGKLHVTYHHNWWGQLVHERMPRVRFGRVHVYNNFYNSPGNNNCIRAARDSEILVENNYFDSVKNVWELYRTEGLDGKVFAVGNIAVNTTWAAGDDSNSIQIPGTDILSNDTNGLNPLPYAYALDAAAGIPGVVTNNAGVGKGPFAP